MQTGKEAVATVVVDKMRRRMRQNGYHAHITLQVMQQALFTACMLVSSLQVSTLCHNTPAD
jgi:hypothetical protein